MKKLKLSRREQRAHDARARQPVMQEIARMEKKYGARLVSGAFARHQQIRRERQRLGRVKQEIREKITRLGG